MITQNNNRGGSMESKIKQNVLRLSNVIETVNWKDKEKYANYLAQSYYYVRHSTRILSLAASRFSLEDSASHQRFLKHTHEENNHEKLLLMDLKQLGKNIDSYPEQNPIRAFYQIQYYMIEHISAATCLGFILALEGLAVQKGGWFYDLISKTYGEKAGSFLRVHAKEDVEHFAQAVELVAKMGEKDQAEILKAMDTSCYLFARMLLDL